jgi:hypothetical protein
MDQVDPAVSPFAVSEDSLSSRLGVARRELRQARSERRRGVDWDLVSGKILWTENAASAFLASLTPQNGSHPLIDVSEGVAPPPTSPDEPLLRAVHELRVTRWQHKNTHVVCCEPIENGHSQESITVRVKDARMFRTGQRLLARRPTGGSAWEFAGNPDRPTAGPRYPRWPGRW